MKLKIVLIVASCNTFILLPPEYSHNKNAKGVIYTNSHQKRKRHMKYAIENSIRKE